MKKTLIIITIALVIAAAGFIGFQKLKSQESFSIPVEHLANGAT